MAGRFAAGGTAARAAWESIGTYQKACLTAATAKAKAELAALDAAPAALPPNSYGDDLCRGVIAAANIEIGSETERAALPARLAERSEEHTSELQSLMRISYAVFCLTKTNTERQSNTHKYDN